MESTKIEANRSKFPLGTSPGESFSGGTLVSSKKFGGEQVGGGDDYIESYV